MTASLCYSCNRLATCPGCSPPLTLQQLGQTPATLNWISGYEAEFMAPPQMPQDVKVDLRAHKMHKTCA